ncbi:NlpC/P60 family protein [Pseudonocardia zijingensis]|uniref:NlpC/P60 family protein n=2 Tax=Pseudonocardia zijingensis TaxID=153376 RepID=A0ABP4ABP9_9PSEU
MVVVSLLVAAPPAAAQQDPPGNAADAARQLEEVNREAEALTEEWHAAKDTLEQRQSELSTLQAAVEPTRAALEAAVADEEQFRLEIDSVAMSTFESGNLDQLNALLASRSPQEFLDQMSAIETLAVEYRDKLDQLLTKVDDTAQKRIESDAAIARAQAAADEAARATEDVEKRKRDAEKRIDEAQRLLDRLSPQQRRDRRGPELSGPSSISGSGAGVEAIRAAMKMLGKPYRYGAEGPSSFDCSGLTSWAFKQVGITLPRSSSQQARVGTPVPRDQLRPGDLVFFYKPVSHVGIYVGDNKMINAPQTGDVVKYSDISSRPITGARRL